jgi:two-component system KDP operon response regulator KdpE
MSEVAATVLIIEDEGQIRRFIRTSLEASGYRVLEADTGKQGLSEIATHKPDLVILDLGLPDMDGIEVVRRLREWASVPIIVLSARQGERNKITALDLGADDYLTKPFSTGELLARLRVALRHKMAKGDECSEGTFRVGDLSVDRVNRHVHVSDKEIHLTPIEYRLLAVLLKNAGKVITHQVLLKEVWGPGHRERAHYLHIYMGHLRHKLEKDPTRPRYLLTEIGVGYRLSVD